MFVRVGFDLQQNYWFFTVSTRTWRPDKPTFLNLTVSYRQHPFGVLSEIIPIFVERKVFNLSTLVRTGRDKYHDMH